MRSFIRAHWKAIVVIVVLVLLATMTLETRAAAQDASALAARLRAHVTAIASSEHNTATPARLEASAAYIEGVLGGLGYTVERQPYRAGGQPVRNIEVTVGQPSPGARLFVVGAHYDSVPGAPGANDNGSGTAALLELARLLKDTRVPAGTELRLVFFVNEEPPWFRGEDMGSMRHAHRLHDSGRRVAGALILETIGWYSQAPHSQQLPAGLEGRYPDTGNFIAFVATTASADLLKEALAAFKAASTFPAYGLAAPGSVTGVTLSDHASYEHYGYPAIMVTDTAFMRYPYYHTAQDTPDKVDYDSVARVVTGLAPAIRTLVARAD